jgi:glutamyl-tRNA reductase
MGLVVLGLNHKTAPVELRERVVFAQNELGSILQDLNSSLTQESLIVSTCNRTELYAVTDDPAQVRRWLVDRHAIGETDAHTLYELCDHQAMEHAFAVASGLDSLILGEPQILGQLKDAYRVAQEADTVGPILNRLFQNTFFVAKRVRTETHIGAQSVSVAAAAVSLTKQIFTNLTHHTALLVGAGETIELTARHLHAHGLKKMLIVNRSLERAEKLALEFNAAALPLANLNSHLQEADILVSATASPVPLIRKDAVGAALKARRHKPILMIDLAVPRDVEPSVAEFEDVYLYAVDDLKAVISENLKAREEAATQARAVIREEVARIRSESRVQIAVPTIRELRAQAEAHKTHTLTEAKRQLHNGRSADEVMAYLADTLTHRIIHSPSHALRKALERGDDSLIEAARTLFELDDEVE